MSQKKRKKANGDTYKKAGKAVKTRADQGTLQESISDNNHANAVTKQEALQESILDNDQAQVEMNKETLQESTSDNDHANAGTKQEALQEGIQDNDQAHAEINKETLQESTSDSDKNLVIDVLLEEYRQVHERVSHQITLYESTNIKIFMLIGVLLYFSITEYYSYSAQISFFVDFVCFAALPIISIGSVLLSLADLVKVMILGDYLVVIESKINTVLKNQIKKYNFVRNRALDWEYWRIRYGHVNKYGLLSEISFSFIIVFLVFLQLQFLALCVYSI